MSNPAPSQLPVLSATAQDSTWSDLWNDAMTQFRADKLVKRVPAGLDNIHSPNDLRRRFDEWEDYMKALKRNPLKNWSILAIELTVQGLARLFPQLSAISMPDMNFVMGPNDLMPLKNYLTRLETDIHDGIPPHLQENIVSILVNFLKILWVMEKCKKDWSGGRRHIPELLALITLCQVEYGKFVQQERSKKQYSGIKEIKAQGQEISAALEEEKYARDSAAILDLLSGEDSALSHESALNKRYADSWQWFLSSDVYERWKLGNHSFMWIHGKVGSGKTVLCASVIKDIQDSPDLKLAYFYFDTNEQVQKTYRGLLISLVSSLYRSIGQHLLDVRQFCLSHTSSTATNETLLHVLNLILQRSDEDVCVIVDALDECQEQELEQVLKLFKMTIEWGYPKCRVLLTSRSEPDVNNFPGGGPFVLDLAAVDHVFSIKADIRAYVSHEVESHPKLQRWGKEGERKILETLTENANGMWVLKERFMDEFKSLLRFRLVACQLDDLKKCDSSNESLDRVLKALPTTLKEVYDKIIQAIPKMLKPKTVRLVACLAYSYTPLSLAQLSSVLEYDDSECGFNEKLRLQQPEDVFDICSCLVTKAETNGVAQVTLAHASVKDYLLSGHWADFPNSTTCHALFAKICITCIKSSQLGFKELPLTSYALKYWSRHIAEGDLASDDTITKMSRPLFGPEWDERYASFEFFDDELYQMHLSPPSPLVYASLLGMTGIMERFLSEDDRDIRDQNRALLAASHRGHVRVVLQLLEADAEIQAQHDGNRTTALQFAAYKDRLNVLEELITRGADVNQKGFKGGIALHSAAMYGHVDCVKYLLKNGATVDAADGDRLTPLHHACTSGHLEVAKELIENGADVNSYSADTTPLHRASFFRRIEIIELLLKNGAIIDTHNPEAGTALQAACYEGHKDVVQLLLDNGADVNMVGGRCGTALKAAVYKKHDDVTKLLVKHMEDRGLRVPIDDVTLETALNAKKTDIVNLLCDKGLYPEGILESDFVLEDPELVERLLGLGAELTEKAFENGVRLAATRGDKKRLDTFIGLKERYNPSLDSAKALEWALADVSSLGNEAMMTALVREYTVDVCSNEGLALANALRKKQEGAVETLLRELLDDRKKDVDTLLHVAAYAGRDDLVVRLLREHGADINAVDANGHSALEVALLNGHGNLARALIDEGADTHGKGGRVGAPLENAAYSGCLEILKTILEKGVEKEECVAALRRGCEGGRKDVVMNLLDDDLLATATWEELEEALNAALWNGHTDIAAEVKRKMEGDDESDESELSGLANAGEILGGIAILACGILIRKIRATIPAL